MHILIYPTLLFSGGKPSLFWSLHFLFPSPKFAFFFSLTEKQRAYQHGRFTTNTTHVTKEDRGMRGSRWTHEPGNLLPAASRDSKKRKVRVSAKLSRTACVGPLRSPGNPLEGQILHLRITRVYRKDRKPAAHRPKPPADVCRVIFTFFFFY